MLDQIQPLEYETGLLTWPLVWCFQHLNDISDASKRFAVGQQYNAVVQSPGNKDGSVLPLVALIERFEKEKTAPGLITTAQ